MDGYKIISPANLRENSIYWVLSKIGSRYDVNFVLILENNLKYNHITSIRCDSMIRITNNKLVNALTSIKYNYNIDHYLPGLDKCLEIKNYINDKYNINLSTNEVFDLTDLKYVQLTREFFDKSIICDIYDIKKSKKELALMELPGDLICCIPDKSRIRNLQLKKVLNK